jgi:hypothetical protein
MQQYVKGVLDGLSLPTTPAENLTAIITPPVVDTRTTPRAYIWGSTGTDLRRTMPRAMPLMPQTGGFKELVHKIDVWIVWFGAASDVNRDSQFPIVMDTVMGALRNTLDPVRNTVDPQTGAVSEIVAIGENMQWDYAPVHPVADQRYLRYDGRIILEVKEWIQA